MIVHPSLPMKNITNLLLAAGCSFVVASCYTYQPPPPISQNGPSLDSAPGQSRYWNGPMDGQAPIDPNAPLQPVDPAAIVVPNPNQPPMIDPNAPQGSVPPNPGGTYLPSTPAGGSNATVGVPTQPSQPTAPALDNKPAGPPYGIKVNGKPGFVYSPYDKAAGIVDVQGMAPGTKVKCPYTGKVFIVP
jgi:hypothetical protein